MKNGIIVTAAGKGSRFGNVNGKQFISFRGKPLIVYTCQALLSALPYEEFIVTIEADKIDQLAHLFKEYQLPNTIQIISGGETRYDSVKKAFHCIKIADIVWIHDGARPNVSATVVHRLTKAINEYPAVIPGIPCVDTIKLVTDQLIVEETLPRDRLFRIQTPQVFHTQILQKAYLTPHNPKEITDESRLIENMGLPVKIIEGELSNIKITYPEDITALGDYNR